MVDEPAVTKEAKSWEEVPASYKRYIAVVGVESAVQAVNRRQESLKVFADTVQARIDIVTS